MLRTSNTATVTNRANTNTEGMRFIGVSTLVEPMQERVALADRPPRHITLVSIY